MASVKHHFQNKIKYSALECQTCYLGTVIDCCGIASYDLNLFMKFSIIHKSQLVLAVME